MQMTMAHKCRCVGASDLPKHRRYTVMHGMLTWAAHDRNSRAWLASAGNQWEGEAGMGKRSEELAKALRDGRGGGERDTASREATKTTTVREIRRPASHNSMLLRRLALQRQGWFEEIWCAAHDFLELVHVNVVGIEAKRFAAMNVQDTRFFVVFLSQHAAHRRAPV